MAHLVLVRHGLSTYNEQGLWAGWADPPLSEKGKEEARKTALALLDVTFDAGYTSKLIRARDTLLEIKKNLPKSDFQIIEDKSLNERNYGEFTGKNKWDVKKQIGDEAFLKVRRSWDYPIPNGESLKQVYERVIPYYQTEILPKLKEGKNIIVVSSGNTLRALVKYLESISDIDIAKLEIGTGEAYIYQVDNQGNITNKEIRAANPIIP